MLQLILSFLDVSRSFAGRMRDEAGLRSEMPDAVRTSEVDRPVPKGGDPRRRQGGARATGIPDRASAMRLREGREGRRHR